ncbi:hypothetical protein GCM10025876_04460 [Demequina litorisediminis]|uniref:Circularly permuted ATP-grasp type 2 domain-containing protein n=1 Tax=Demequina litorisediminis TaxID=1849022 RepID=A0ABQ6I8T7_9MICO|nr:hypothetical protein GCM10025876_04460 [Demequina litorisediminis]
MPTLTEDGLEPRHVDLRPFAINDGDDVWVLPGGLTRVALERGQAHRQLVSGGGSKDTWVLGGVRDRTPRQAPEAKVEFGGMQAVPQTAHPEDAVAGQQQQQQQQQAEGGSEC